MKNARVFLWGNEVGDLSLCPDEKYVQFQYSRRFLESTLEISPLVMPLCVTPYIFQALEQITFKGLPGVIADSLPDKFGNKVFQFWLKHQNNNSIFPNTIEQLCFIGDKGFGALEYKPDIKCSPHEPKKVELAKLVEISNLILNPQSFQNNLQHSVEISNLVDDIFFIGTYAGGSRAKIAVNWNPFTNDLYFGHNTESFGCEPWLIKLDGITNNRDKEQVDQIGYGKIECAYYLMAIAAGIEMSDCRLIQDGNFSHFATKRFDRNNNGEKIHMQSLCAIAHWDFNQAGVYSYEQAIQIMTQLRLPKHDFEQFILRAFFNIIGRNQDDHVKNIAFLMNPCGAWRLSPAFDVTFAYDPTGKWTSCHQMNIAGKRDNFVEEDLISLAKFGGVNKTHAYEMIERVIQAIKEWPSFAYEAGIDELTSLQVQNTHRLSILHDGK